MMTKHRALEIVAMLSAAFPNWNLTEATQRVWVAFLSPIECELAQRAAIEMIGEPRAFAPSIGEFFERARKTTLEIEGIPEVDLEDAWALVADAIRSVGSYRQPTFKNPSIVRTVEAIGWSILCRSTEIEATRKHFMRLFTAFEGRRVKDGGNTLIGWDPLKLIGSLPPALAARNDKASASQNRLNQISELQDANDSAANKVQ
jgi:Loader and inhibitor of phage G40P